MPYGQGPRCARSAAVLLAALATSAIAQPVPRLAAVPVATGLTYPLFVTAPSGDRDRLFIVEKGPYDPTGFSTAYIRILNLRTGVLNPQLFAAIPVASGGEGGLLGMAFDPDYDKNGYFYLHHTNANPRGSRIVRYRVLPGNPDRFDHTSATELWFEPQASPVHHGGWIAFGPDGYLYFAIGDVGHSPNSQNLTSPFGKILRIDVRTTPPSIPPTNPFSGSATNREDIWAYGLRNPWRASFDRHTGDLWIGDVGQNTWEEVNFQPAAVTPPITARNYGWPLIEGPCMPPCQPHSGITYPIHWFSTQQNYYIAGGYVYRGAAIPELRGAYFFSGAGNTRIWSLRYDGAQVSDLIDWTPQLQQSPPAQPLSGIVSMGEDDAGELYMTSHTPGIVYKIVPRCRANCDGSTQHPVLDIADFMCFIDRFAADDPYANCDQSTIEPVLNVDDFTCFVNQFAAGCP